MKKVFFGLLAVVTIGLTGLAFVFNNKPDETGDVKSIYGYNQASQIIDVREVFEYKSSHADGAVNIPLSKIDESSLSNFNKNKDVWVYCQSGERAELARHILEKLGFRKVKNIGGLGDWSEGGGKICKTEKKDC